MKVYTEVNYIWKDNKLVQTDSKSFDYEGEVEQAGFGFKWRPPKIPSIPDIKKATATNITSITSSTKTNIKGAKDIIKEGPKGTLGDITDALYGGDTKAAVTSVQETYKDFEGGVQYYKDELAEKSGVTDATNQITTIGSNLVKTDDDVPTILTPEPSPDESSLTPSLDPIDLEEGGTGMIGGRKGKQSRKQMVTTSKRASILDPNPYG